MVSRLMYEALRCGRVPLLLRSVRRRAVVLAYHNVIGHSPTRGDAPLHVHVDAFEQQMRWLSRHYDCVTLGALTDELIAGRSVGGLAAVTFDDGYAGVIASALPVLRALGVPATMLVVPGVIGDDRGFWWDQLSDAHDGARRTQRVWALGGDGTAILRDAGVTASSAPTALRAAGWDAVRAAAAQGVEIGGHSMWHRTLPLLDDANLDSDVRGCLDAILHATGTRPVTFAYPYGAWDLRVREAVRRAGWRAAVTTDPGLVHPRSDPLALSRISVPAGLPMSTFENWTSGVGRWRSAS